MPHQLQRELYCIGLPRQTPFPVFSNANSQLESSAHIRPLSFPRPHWDGLPASNVVRSAQQ
eukprot:scaffold1869_cov182-Alexandrium_tamarense.AAC.3